jgi:hypothetical protein
MTQDARDDRLLGHGGNNAERAASAQGTGGHIQRKHAPQEPGPAPGRCASLRLILIHTLLARRWENRLSQLAVRRQTPSIADEVDARQGTSAARFSNSSRGESLTPVVPSDHGFVKVYTRSPWASSTSRSSATAPLAVYRIKRSNWSRRYAGTWVLACSENPWALAQRGPVSAGSSPSYPKPEPIRRTACPARSPKTMRCLTEAAMVRANSGALSSNGSYPIAIAASLPASRYPSWRSLRMTRRLIFWSTAVMSASLGGISNPRGTCPFRT